MNPIFRKVYATPRFSGALPESVAHHFSTSKEAIMAASNMKTETIDAGMELIIPLCDLTPTSTVHPAAFTTTHTPALSPASSTPGG